MFFNLECKEVVKAYNGKEGCMCGCNGNYVDDQNSKAFKRRINKIMNFIGPMRPDSANKNDAATYSTEPYIEIGVEQMNKYLVFVYDLYYPYGGHRDLQGVFDTLQEAEQFQQKIADEFDKVIIMTVDALIKSAEIN